jgi:transposase
VREAQIFVAVLGCSNYTYAEATWTQSLPGWLGSHVRALEFYSGAPAAFVPDNLKSGVDRAHRYDPDLNRAYAEFAGHYGLAILPARVRKPRDKAKVETGVQIVERWILARLRDRRFFSLTELNAAIDSLRTELNERAFQKLDGSRRSRFIELDRPALKALPARAYEYAQWKCAKVHPDYHIEVEHAYYSVPYQHIGARVEVRVSARMIEISPGVNSSLHTCVRSNAVRAQLSMPIGPRTIVRSSTPRSSGCSRAPRRSGRPSPACSPSSSTASAIPKRRCASHKESCGSHRTSRPHSSPPPANAHCGSRPAVTAVCVP